MAKHLTVDEYVNLKRVHCDRGKHRFRENKFGIVWCTICGLLSVNNKGAVEPLKEEDKLIIQCN